MLCVLRMRSSVLPFRDHLFLNHLIFSACYTHAVRIYRCASDNLFERGESASEMLILSPLTGFLSRSLFHNSPLSCGERMFFDGFHDFSRQISSLSVLCSIVGMCSFGCCMEGDGEGGKRGTGGENPEGEGGLQPGCPPFPGLSPQDSGRSVLRKRSTQIIKDKHGKDGHRR